MGIVKGDLVAQQKRQDRRRGTTAMLVDNEMEEKMEVEDEGRGRFSSYSRRCDSDNSSDGVYRTQRARGRATIDDGARHRAV